MKRNPMYEKCSECHLFVEYNSEHEDDLMLAEYLHLHRGTADDEALDSTHEARSSGILHTVDYWMEHGPHAMRARFRDLEILERSLT